MLLRATMSCYGQQDPAISEETYKGQLHVIELMMFLESRRFLWDYLLQVPVGQ